MSKHGTPNVFSSAFETICVLLAAVFFIVVSIFAIIMLIPSRPFGKRHITAGVVLLVLDVIATAILFSWIVGYFYRRHREINYHQVPPLPPPHQTSQMPARVV